jgi:hypothetical protein
VRAGSASPARKTQIIGDMYWLCRRMYTHIYTLACYRQVHCTYILVALTAGRLARPLLRFSLHAFARSLSVQQPTCVRQIPCPLLTGVQNAIHRFRPALAAYHQSLLAARTRCLPPAPCVTKLPVHALREQKHCSCHGETSDVPPARARAATSVHA